MQHDRKCEDVRLLSAGLGVLIVKFNLSPELLSDKASYHVPLPQSDKGDIY